MSNERGTMSAISRDTLQGPKVRDTTGPQASERFIKIQLGEIGPACLLMACTIGPFKRTCLKICNALKQRLMGSLPELVYDNTPG